jgi:hypothetical protein
MWRRLIKRLLFVGVILVVSVAATARWAHHQTRKVPEFYERAIAASPTVALVQSSETLEANVQQLQDDAARIGQWEAAFSAEQINAWLIEQLPKRLPMLKPRGLQDPRIMIEDGMLRAAARFKDHRMDAVLSCELSVKLTDHPNRLAISVMVIRAGALPLPLSQFKERIKKITSNTNLNLQWETREGETVALIDVPDAYPGHVDGSVVIESIELSDQRLTVAGQTGESQAFSFEPRGPVYRVASIVDDVPIGGSFPVRRVHADDVGLDSSLE